MIKINCRLADDIDSNKVLSEPRTITWSHSKLIATIVRDDPNMVVLDKNDNQLATIYIDYQNHLVYAVAADSTKKVIFSRKLSYHENLFREKPGMRILTEICQHIDAYYENQAAIEEKYNFQEAAMKLLKWYYSMNGFMPMLIKKRALNKLSLNKFYGKDIFTSGISNAENEVEFFKNGDEDINDFVSAICWLFDKKFEDFEPLLRDYIQELT